MKTYLPLFRCLIGCLSLLLAVLSAQAQTPFTCSPNFYQIRNGNQLAVYNPATGDLTNIGPPNIGCNAAGYNLVDNFAYALHEVVNPSNFSMLRIESTGAATTVATIAFPTNINPNSGDCDLSGNYYMTHLYDMYKVDIAAAKAAYPATYNAIPYTLSFPDGAVQGNNDAAFNAVDGKFYTIDGYTGYLAVLTLTGPSSAVVNRIPMSGPITALTTGAGFGSVWCDANGDFFAFHNTTGEYYKVNIATGFSLLVSTSSTQAFNDGFSCATAANPLPCAISVNAAISACTGSNYNLNLLVQYNNPPAGSTGFTLSVGGVNQGLFPFGTYPSGSTITIPNLPGDGTTNIAVNVAMNTGSCTASTSYNEPVCCSGFTLPPNGSSVVACPNLAVQPAPPTVLDGSGAAVTPTGPTVTNNPSPISCEGTRTYSWVYTNCSGSQTWSFVYTIERNPFTVPANGAATVACPALATQPTPPAVQSNCGEAVVPTGPAVSATPACEGTKTYAWTYTDCEGNSAVWSFVYTIERNDFTVPANGFATVSCPDQTDMQPTPPVVLGNCGEILTPSLTGVTPKNGCEGNRVYTFTYTDCEGNAHNWLYTYQVEYDDFAMPANESHSLECSGLAWQATPPTVFDRCGRLLNPIGPDISSTDNAFGCEGSRSYTWTYKDCEGNSHQWVSSFTFIYSHDFDIYPNKTSEVSCIGYAVMPTPPTVYDWCGNVAQVKFLSMDEELADGGCNGVRIYNFVYSDCGGHSHPWSVTFFINDKEAPLGICPAGAVTLNDLNVDVMNLSCIGEVPCPTDHDFSQKIEQLLEAGDFFDVCSGADLLVELDSWTELWECADPDGDGQYTFGRTFYFRIADQCGNEYPSLCSVTYSGNCSPIETFPQDAWGIAGNEPGSDAGANDLQVISTLLMGNPLVVGGGNRSLTLTDANCVVALLPGIGLPSVLGNCHQTNCTVGCNPAGSQGMKNSLVANTAALMLNMRYNVSYNGLAMNSVRSQGLGCVDISPNIQFCNENGCQLRVFETNGTMRVFPYTIGGLVDMANLFLGGNLQLSATISSLYAAALNTSVVNLNSYFHGNMANAGACSQNPGALPIVGFEAEVSSGKRIQSEISLELAPNPADQEVRIRFGELETPVKIEMVLYNVVGQVVHRNDLGTASLVDERLSLDCFKSGIYFVVVKAGGQHMEKKLLINRD